jgi:hypothetical protein
MTKQLKQAIAILSTLPDDLQDQLAGQFIRYLHEISVWNDGADVD